MLQLAIPAEARCSGACGRGEGNKGGGDGDGSVGGVGGGLRGGVDAGRNQVQDASYHPHLPQNQGTISEIEVVEGEVQRRKTRATLLTGSLFGGLFVVYKAASMGYLLF